MFEAKLLILLFVSGGAAIFINDKISDAMIHRRMAENVDRQMRWGCM
jgi:hypothetical protein